MKIKKCVIASIAAMAMVCSSLTGLCYADKENFSGKTAAASASESKSKLSGITKIRSPFESILDCLITDDGQIYYIGYNSHDGGYIFTMDKKGNVDKKAKLYNYCADIKLKQIGDNICVLYNDSYDLGYDDDKEEGWRAVTLPPDGGVKDLYMVMFDKDLNQISKNDITSYASVKRIQFVGVNSKNVFYVRGFKKLYISDYDGSNKKVLLDINKISNGDYSDCYIDSIAVTEDYAALYFSERSDGEGVYCAVIELATGRLVSEKRDSSGYPEAFGDTIIWRGTLSAGEASASNAMSGEELKRQTEERVKSYAETLKKANEAGNMPGAKLLMFKDRKFSNINTETPIERTVDGDVDNDGRLITYSTVRNDDPDEIYGYNLVIRVYENNKCIKKIELDARDYSPKGAENSSAGLLTANDGMISVRYSYKMNGKYSCGILLIPYEN